MNLNFFKTLAACFVCLLFCIPVIGQQTVTITGNDFQDALIQNATRPGREYTVTTNYGSNPRISAIVWTNSGYISYFRSLLSFNLSAIRPGSFIQSATLYLYSDPTVTGSDDANGNSQLSGSNAFYLEKVVAPWDEYTVTWNTEPATTTTGRVWVGPSTSTTENLQLNLTSFVQGWVNDPQSNHGLQMILENEMYYRSRNYASTNHPNSAIHPKLIVNFYSPPPASPTGLIAQATSSTSISLSWTDNSTDEDLFEIERSLTAGSGYSLIGTTSPNVVTFVDSDLAVGTTYYYRIRALNEAGASYSNDANATTLSVPNEPTDLIVQATSPTSIRLNWADNSSSEAGFEIERSLTSGSGYALIHTTAANVSTYIDENLSPSTDYFYRIRAVNSVGSSAYTIEAPVKTLTEPQVVLNDLVFQYRYDERKRVIKKKVPGADWIYMVYDERDRLVMTQDGNQRVDNKWSFIKYDALNRPIITGIYTHNTPLDQSQMSDLISTNIFYETRDDNAPHGYTNAVFPSANFIPDNFDVLTVTYYDDDSYKILIKDENNVADSRFNYKADEFASEQYVYHTEGSSFPYLKGLVTATKTKVLDEGPYLWSVNHYDDKYRVVQNISTNGLGETDRITTIYDFAGKVMKTKTAHNEGTPNEQTIERKFDYDHAGRLLRTWHKLNDHDWVLLISHEYNELGQLVTKKLHRTSNSGDEGTPVTADPLVGQPGVVYNETITSSSYNSVEHTYVASHQIRLLPGFSVASGASFKARIGYSEEDALQYNNQFGTFVQTIDYRYTIRGWLESINDITMPESGDLFSMNLNYNTPTSNGGTSQFNGNISEILWKGPDTQVNSYGYYYDPMDRLVEAKYYNATRTEKNGRFNEKIWNVAKSESGYDLNGNINFLQRNGKRGIDDTGVTIYGQIDNLVYSYKGNQLLNVMDGSVDIEGFIDGSNSDNDYTYDENGNMIIDKNKLITGANTSVGNSAITYNYLNLPAKVVKDNGEYIRYIYDAAGRKLSQEVYNASNQLQKKNDYAGEFFYQDNVLKFVNHEEGRVVIDGSQPEYQYHLKDHLGSIRVTFTTKAETESVKATLETTNMAVEESQFLRYENARKVHAYYFDRTNGSAPALTDGYAQRLSGGENERYGLARSISVMPGDKVTAEVYAKYVDAASSDPNFTSLLAQIAQQISDGATSSGLVVDGGSFGASTSSFPFAAEAAQNTAESSDTGPKAYLNWLVFDRDYNLILEKSGYDRLSSTPKESGQDVAHERLYSPEITIEEAGYVYVFLSNEENAILEVYFDDFRIEHIKSSVVQINDYYPFGLSFNHYQRENSVENKFLFNGGSELQTEMNLNLYFTPFRLYDPAIGRFLQVDPMADFFPTINPYSFAFDNPILFGDPYGLSPTIWQRIKAFIGIGRLRGKRRARNQEYVKPVARSKGKPKQYDFGMPKSPPTRTRPPASVQPIQKTVQEEPEDEPSLVYIPPGPIPAPKPAQKPKPPTFSIEGQEIRGNFDINLSKVLFEGGDSHVIGGDNTLLNYLSPLAQYLKVNPSVSIQITLTTPLGQYNSMQSHKSVQQVQRERLKALRDAMERMGVSRQRIWGNYEYGVPGIQRVNVKKK